MAFIKVDENHRIVSASEHFHCGAGEIEVNFPDQFKIQEAHNWLYDGKFIYLPQDVLETPDECKILREEVNELRANNDLLTGCILELSELFYGDVE